MHEVVRLLALAMILTVPAYDGEWPTLGFQVVKWMQDNLVHGPGDVRGEPLQLDDEKIGFILRMYEVFPQGHENEGRRRFDRCCLSLSKGLAKTELGALVAAAELHPEAPVRCDGFYSDGTPRGRAVRDPFIPLVAYTEEQSDELAYGALRIILLNSRVAEDFDIGYERIVRKVGDGKAVSLASSPGARDGARTTHQLMDETHRWITPELRKTHETMLANIPKRSAQSEPWTLELTTAFDPSERSVAQATMNYARHIAEGRVKNSRLFYFHRQADDTCDLSTSDGLREAVIQSRGPHAIKWTKNVDAIIAQFDDPGADKNFLARMWLNQIRHATARAFDVQVWGRRYRPDYVVPAGALIGLGFDGSLADDATALIGTEIPTGFQWPIVIFERPPGNEPWMVPEVRVDEAVADAFGRYEVWRLYGDPFYWGNWMATWAGRYGEDRVVRWPTNQWRKMADAVRAYVNAMSDEPEPEPQPEAKEGEAPPPPAEVLRLSHNGDPVMARHIANSHRMVLGMRDRKGEPLWVIQKERKDSPLKIDAAVGGVLSWQVRRDAIALGAAAPKKKSVYEERGLITL